MQKRPAAFFDLDGTLLRANTAKLWMEREWKEGRLATREILRGAVFLGLYRFGVVDMEKATAHALATIAGVPEEEIRQRTHDWYERWVAPTAAADGLAAVRAHQARGHAVWLLTSSSPYASECAVRQFGLDGYDCTIYELADGRFTGRPVAPICFGEGKIHWAERRARAEDLDLDDSYFYTDSLTDRPLLERVAHPRVVNPDPRLRRLAGRRGWPILDWQ